MEGERKERQRETRDKTDGRSRLEPLNLIEIRAPALLAAGPESWCRGTSQWTIIEFW